jgi:hypothetical protein
VKIQVEKIFKDYDFGFDLDLVSAEEWLQDANHYYRQVYLEDKTKIVPPIPATFHVYIEGNGKVQQVVVQM